jgi:glutamate dehydrogenase (NAD(P)+)
MTNTLPWPVDEHGPLLVSVLRLPEDCTGVVVVDDVTLGPAIGGVRVGPSVTPTEVARLARAMTLKSAAAKLPHGGGKAGIRTPGELDRPARERVLRAFAHGIRNLTEYIPGPDMGTDETAMAWIHDEIGRAVGLPSLLGGIPLDEIGATGYGLAICAEALESAGRLTVSGLRVAVQGFGAVGGHVARALYERGAQIVAVSDRTAALYQPDGLDIPQVFAFRRGDNLVDYHDAKHLDHVDDLLTIDCDLLIPAAQPDVINEDNADLIQARTVLQGANIPATAAAEAALHARGVLCIPDVIANAGGVICASVEYHGGSRADAFRRIEELLRANVAEVLDGMARTGRPPRAVAQHLARARLDKAASYRRRY